MRVYAEGRRRLDRRPRLRRFADGGRPLEAGRAAALLAGVLLIVSGCATTGATTGSGVGDAYLDRAPYYAGQRLTRAGNTIAHLPIAYQRGAEQEAIFDPRGEPGTPVGALISEMNLYLDSLLSKSPLVIDQMGRAVPPDVRFGCAPTTFDTCRATDQDVDRAGRNRMRLTVGRPSRSWVAAMAPALETAGDDLLLVITLEIGEYWVHQKNLLGGKEVRLGTAHTMDVPWLTSLDQPVQVLQLTGAVVDREGRAVRIGAEGLLARRTNLVLSGLGAQALIGESDIELVRTIRREDLAGRPLAWQVALGNLVAQLTGDAELAVR
jgi:hypothetical protein